MDYINAFWVGGLICALAQILLDRTKLMPGRVMVLLVCSGAVLGALHIYQPIQDYAGAGASVPLAGFGNLLWKGVKEAVDKEGFIGIFLGGFKASAVGISAALVFGYLASLRWHDQGKRRTDYNNVRRHVGIFGTCTGRNVRKGNSAAEKQRPEQWKADEPL